MRYKSQTGKSENKLISIGSSSNFPTIPTRAALAD